MKVAICVGGLTYPDSNKLMKELKNTFPDYPIFYGVWKGRETELSKELNAFVYDEFEPKYHPYLDIDKNTWPPKIKDIVEKMHRHGGINSTTMKMILKAWHQTKQIIMHSYMLKDIPEEYDMIIRTRFDIWLYDKTIPYNNFIKESYNENKAIGFSRKLSSNNGPYWSAKGTNRHNWWEGFLQDLIIMHPRKLFDEKRMWELYNNKKLLAAEFGWYQVLSEPHGSNHDCYFTRLNMTSRDGYRKI